MSTASLCTVILTKNQASLVVPLIESALAVSDQVIILDDFSSDEILEVGKTYNITVFQHRLNQDFAAHRNAVFSQISTDWVLFLDADEQPETPFWSEVEQAIQDSSVAAYRLRRRMYFLGRKLRFGEGGEQKILRLARTDVGRDRWQRPVHEVWRVNTSKVGEIQSPLWHQEPPSLSEFLAKLHRYAQLEVSARTQYSKVVVLGQLALYPVGKFLQNYFWRLGFLDGFPGLAMALLMSYYSAVVRVMVYESLVVKK